MLKKKSFKKSMFVVLCTENLLPLSKLSISTFYLRVLRCLQENVQRKHSEHWWSGDWFLNHNNTPGHTALSVNCFLASHRELLSVFARRRPHTSFYFYQRMTKILKVKRLHSDTTRIFKTITYNGPILCWAMKSYTAS